MLTSTVLLALTTLILTTGEIKSQFSEAEPPYSEISIYLSASEARVGDNLTFTCRVTSVVSGVQPEDTGGYGCYVTGYDDLYALKILEVYRKPIAIYFNHAIIPGIIKGNKTLVVVRENETPNITCRVSDIMPEAAVTILFEREVITEFFDVKVIQNIYPSHSDAEASIPLHNSYTMEATNRDFKVSFEQDGKTLTCIAKMKGFEEDVVAAKITLIVLYAPKIICAGSWNATDLVNSCRIFSIPPVKIYNKTVSIQESETTVIVRPGEDSPLYSLHDSVLPNTDERMSAMVFIIKTVTEDHFTNVYTFYAANSEGTATKTILIENILSQLEDGVEGILIGGTRPFSLLLLLLFLVKIFVS